MTSHPTRICPRCGKPKQSYRKRNGLWLPTLPGLAMAVPWQWLPVGDDECSCGGFGACPPCSDDAGGVPGMGGNFTVTFSGVTTAACANCSWFDGAIALPDSYGDFLCVASNEQNPSPCTVYGGQDYVLVCLGSEGGHPTCDSAEGEIQVLAGYWGDYGDYSYAVFITDLDGESVACNDLCNYDIPFSHHETNSVPLQCDFSEATCTLSAV